MKYCPKCGTEVSGRFCQSCGHDTKPEIAENVKETVDKLYALRTGLSYVSVKKDDYKKEKEKLDGELSASIKKRDDNKRLLASEKQSLIDTESFIIKTESEREKNKEIVLKNDKLSKKYKKIIPVGTAIYITSSIISVLLFLSIIPVIFVCLGNNVSLKPAAILFGLAIVFGIIFIIAIDKTSTREKYKKKADDEIFCINRDNATAMNAKKSLPTLKQRVENLSRNVEITEKKVETTRVMLKEVPLPHLIKSNAAYDALVKEYTPLLDIRDWEKLDLIIFYLETGRAETMKEALQLVDRQIQTDSIIQAINTASEQICNRIEQSMYDVNNTVIRCASILSLQLETISDQQSKMISGINAMSNTLSNELQRALKSKSSVSSKELADDVHQMRIYAENEAIRRRNS